MRALLAEGLALVVGTNRQRARRLALITVLQRLHLCTICIRLIMASEMVQGLDDWRLYRLIMERYGILVQAAPLDEVVVVLMMQLLFLLLLIEHSNQPNILKVLVTKFSIRCASRTLAH